MARNTIGDVISRIRSQMKASKQDAFITDRMIYAFVLKHAKWLMKREDGKGKLMAFSSVIQTLDFVELQKRTPLIYLCHLHVSLTI